MDPITTHGDRNNKAIAKNLVKFRVCATIGNKKETAKMTAAKNVVNLYLSEIEISIFLGRNITARMPITKKRFTRPDTNRLIQLAAVKTVGKP
jgi:hypothetical protein